MQNESDLILSGILDDHFLQMANAVEDYMKHTKDQITEERKLFFTPQIEELKSVLNQAQDEYARMQAEAGETTNELVRQEAILAHLVQLCGSLHQKVRNSNNQSRAFNAWRQMGTEKLILVKVAKRLFFKNAMRRIFFKRWIRKMHAKRENRVNNEIKKRYEKIWKAKSIESQKVIDELSAIVAEKRRKLEEKERRDIEMQQKLRKAFMRGVVNMNLEAMDVFNGSPFLDLLQEVEGNEADHRDDETSVNESDDDFYVEEAPPISVIRHH